MMFQYNCLMMEEFNVVPKLVKFEFLINMLINSFAINVAETNKKFEQ